MNIFVCIKQVPDTEAALTVQDGVKVNEANIKWIINPFDEFAIEEALKLAEQISGSSVTALTVGPKRAESALRSALAMGAEKAIHIECEETLDHKITAKAISNILSKNDPGVIFTGKQAIDDDSFLTHAYLAEYLNIPLATNVIKFQYSEDTVTVERDIDEGDMERIEMKVPCLVAATKGLNEPRYASLMGIMKAKKKPMEIFSMEDAGVTEINPMVKVEKLFSPPEKPEGKIVEGEPQEAVKKLVDLLKNEAQVL